MIYIIATLIVLGVWGLIWKAFGLWHSARRSHTIWFVAMLILNTAGILPIIYLAWKTDFFKNCCKTKTVKKRVVKKRKITKKTAKKKRK